MHKTAAFATLGCKVNQYETQAMRELLEKAGFIILPFEEAADLYIINSCTVTNVADRKSRQHIGQARKKNPDAPVIMSGCLAQRDAEHILAIEGVAAVLGNAGRKQIVEIAERVLAGERNIAVVGDILHNHKFDDIRISKNDERLRANLKICDGCQNFCSYCIIPYTRGPVRSRPLEEIRAEALELVKTGIKEIVLTGIEVASYGRDMENRFGLLDAIKAARVPGIERIRLSSLEASILTEDFCRQAA
ncbi:MAG: radical SAM protein, partial [Christensenellaceae bacterium]|nr:radical SAM protein [Christensenellaceae bacterium]